MASTAPPATEEEKQAALWRDFQERRQSTGTGNSNTAGNGHKPETKRCAPYLSARR